MKDNERIKELVKQKYGEIAEQTRSYNASSCCGSGPSTLAEESIMAEDYTKLEGYASDADLGLGCGLPTKFAHIHPGDTVIDLGSGAGNDCFVARSVTGPSGKVIGIDFTEKMIMKARANAEKLGYNNVEFRQGDVEQMPVSDNAADVVVSNCVLNLVPNKTQAFLETFRVLKPGGHFSVSDIVLDGHLPERLQHVAELYAGCISGAIQKDEYLKIIEEAGFRSVVVQKEKTISIPDEILSKHLSGEEMEEFRRSNTKILSVTVYGEKPGVAEKFNKTPKEACCEPGCC